MYLAFGASMLVTKNILGIRLLSHISHALMVPTSTPALPFTTITAASATLMASSNCPTKSKYPGASRMLILSPFHSTGITDALIENFLFISSLS